MCPLLDGPPHPNVLRFGIGCLSHCVKAGSEKPGLFDEVIQPALLLVNADLKCVMNSLRNQFSNFVE